MPAPTVTRTQEQTGRSGTCLAHVRWDADNTENLASAVILDTSELSTAAGQAVTSPRFKVTHVEWASNATLSGDLWFDSMAPGSDSDIFSFPDGATAGEHDFESMPSGGKTDPVRDGPGNVVLATRNSAAGDELFLKVDFVIKGVRPVAG